MTIANLPCFCPVRLVFLDIPVQDKYFISLHISGASRFNNYKLWNYLELQMYTDTLEGFRETTQKELELRGSESICSCHCLEGDTCHVIGVTSSPDLFPYLTAIPYIPTKSNLWHRLVYNFSLLTQNRKHKRLFSEVGPGLGLCSQQNWTWHLRLGLLISSITDYLISNVLCLK